MEKPLFRVMTYNTRRSTGLDGRVSPERIAGLISAYNPDVVALQEVDVNRKRTRNVDQAKRLGELTGLQSYFFPRVTEGDEQYGIALLSKHPMEIIKADPLPSTHIPPPKECVGAIWAQITWGEKPLQFIATHFNHNYTERSRQIRSLLGPAWLRDPRCKAPFFFCGDLNTTRRSPIYGEVRDQLRDAQELYGQYKKTWPSFLPLMRIDHIFVSEGITVKNIETPNCWAARWASDHLPLIADFVM
ncbi:MAG: hypothetical protein KCHDKBKB_02953 [Elusimicrobia bacterium]|nr:hypothetical protein [Elusimicrobiota bacterium]